MAGSPRKPDQRSKKGAKATVTLLMANDNPVVPPMPDPTHFIGVASIQTNVRGRNDTAILEKAGVNPDRDHFDPEEMEAEWAPAVVDWWNSIWTSPMASEFVESDVHGLYFACYYMHEALNPFYKPSDRLGFSKQWEAAIKNYGLTPASRESLRWNIAQGTAAQKRTDQIRASASAGRASEGDSISDMFKRHA
ncbi:MAG: hypothetical protein PHW63_08910 [Alphaproteobacteria bacterium]|nr:hypothetical protein [Alphaproteobacteria bacterium]